VQTVPKRQIQRIESACQYSFLFEPVIRSSRMKKRYVPIITFTLGVLLIGTVVYAADKKKKAKMTAQDPPEVSEEALTAELLSEQQERTPNTKSVRLSKSSAADTVRVKDK
jgi:hypothetical protein